ncbi:MAG: sugar phosphate isomerase/epimerase [Candidatus Brockarchaeota archaeon]|nr:sugar phosphate isomerase/epimerase [Candidatus Brockarchaeota archaeon]
MVPRLRKAINYWSFPGGSEGAKDVRECLKEAKAFGFEGVELCLSEKGEVSLESDPKGLERLAKDAKAMGVEISSLASGLLWGSSLTSEKPSTRKRAKEIVRKQIEAASALGTDAILVIPGAVDVFFMPGGEVVQYDAVYERLREAIQDLLPFAEKHGVAIGLENVWNKFLLSPLEARDFVDSFKSKYVGIFFDTGNVMPFGYPEQWIRILGKRIKRVHVKDFRRGVGTVEGFVDLLEGDVNWPEVVKALGEAGYGSYLIAEMIPLYKHYPLARIRNASTALDYILGRTRS